MVAENTQLRGTADALHQAYEPFVGLGGEDGRYPVRIDAARGKGGEIGLVCAERGDALTAEEVGPSSGDEETGVVEHARCVLGAALEKELLYATGPLGVVGVLFFTTFKIEDFRFVELQPEVAVIVEIGIGALLFELLVRLLVAHGGDLGVMEVPFETLNGVGVADVAELLTVARRHVRLLEQRTTRQKIRHDDGIDEGSELCRKVVGGADAQEGLVVVGVTSEVEDITFVVEVKYPVYRVQIKVLHHTPRRIL